MAPPNKKRRVITQDVKKQVIDASATKRLKELSEEFELPLSTVQTILKNKTTILQAIDQGVEAKRSHLKAVKQDDLETAVLQWFKQQRSANVSMTGPLLQEKARDLAKELAKRLRSKLERLSLSEEPSELAKDAEELENFKASDGWLYKFKKRHSIQFKEKHAELNEDDLSFEGDQSPGDELATIWASLEAQEMVEGDLEDYLTVDNQLVTGGMLSLAEIAADASTANDEEIGEDSDDGDVTEIDDEPEPPVKAGEAKNALRILQRYLDENSADPSLQRLCDKFDDFLAEESVKKLKQKSILDYFVASNS